MATTQAAPRADDRHPSAAPAAPARRPFRSPPLALAALIVGFLLCAATYSVAAPLWEASDESEHFQYIVYLLTDHQLPTRLPSIQPSGNNEGNQPPLYYALVAPAALGLDLRDTARIRLNPHMGWVNDPGGVQATAHLLDEAWPYHGAFLAAHRIRLLSALLGAATLLLTYAAALACSGSRRLALLATALLALLPGFLFASATIDNDALANTLGALLLFLVVRSGATSVRRALAFGAASALALLTKLDLVPLIALGGLALLWRSAAAVPAVAGGGRAVRFLAMLLPALPAVAFWLWRVGQGEHNLVGDKVTWPPPLPGSGGPPDWSVPVQFAVDMLRSLLGAFGRQNVFLPAWLYAVYGVVYLGAFVLSIRGLRRAGGPEQRGLLLLWIALPFLAIVGRYFFVTGPRTGYDSSRFLYPALPAFIILAVYGLRDLARRWPGLARWSPVPIGAGALSAFALPWLVIAPTYPPPFPVTDAVPPGPTRLAADPFAGSVTLAAIAPPTGPVPAGQAFALTMYWRVAKPLPDGTWLFVHVVNGAGQTATAFDGAPLYNALPLSYWRPGDVVIDREILTVHANAAPGSYAIHVGWYDPKTGVRVPLADGGNDLTAGSVTVGATPG